MPAVGHVEAAEDVHQRGLAGAGRAHDGHVVAALDGEATRRAGRAPRSRPRRTSWSTSRTSRTGRASTSAARPVAGAIRPPAAAAAAGPPPPGPPPPGSRRRPGSRRLGSCRWCRSLVVGDDHDLLADGQPGGDLGERVALEPDLDLPGLAARRWLTTVTVCRPPAVRTAAVGTGARRRASATVTDPVTVCPSRTPSGTSSRLTTTAYEFTLLLVVAVGAMRRDLAGGAWRRSARSR